MAGPGFINDQPWFKGGVPVFGGGHGCGVTCEQLAAYEGPLLLDTTQTKVETFAWHPSCFVDVPNCGLMGMFSASLAGSAGCNGGFGRSWETEDIPLPPQLIHFNVAQDIYVWYKYVISICFQCPASQASVSLLRVHAANNPAFPPPERPPYDGNSGVAGWSMGEIAGNVYTLNGGWTIGGFYCCRQIPNSGPTNVHVIVPVA